MAKKTAKKEEVMLTLEEATKAVLKAAGKGALIGDDIVKFKKVEKVPTGIPTLDYLLGGGMSVGKNTIFAGNPSACKSTVSMQIIAALIRHMKSLGITDKFILWYDPEAAFDPDYAARLGIDMKYVIMISDIKVLETMFEHSHELINMGFIYGLVVDSIDGLIPRKQDDNLFGNTMGSQSGALASHLPSLFAKMSEFKVTSIFIKQARVKMNVQSKGEIITFSGGKALRHFADTIFIFKRMSSNNLTYTPIQVKAEKTRSSRMGLTLEVPLFDAGIDVRRDLVALATAHGFLEFGGGGWIEFNGKKIQGQDNFLEELKSDREFYEQLRTDVYEQIINVSSVICESTGEILVDDGTTDADV